MKDLMNFLSALEKMKMPFNFSQKKSGLRIIANKKLNVKGATLFFDYLEGSFTDLDYFHLNPTQRACVQKLNIFAKRFSVELKKKSVYKRLFGLNLGIQESKLDRFSLYEFDFYKFFIVNGFHETMVSLTKKIQYSEKHGIYIPVFVDGMEKWVPLYLLDVKKEQKTWRVYFKNRIVLEVLEDYSLTQDYLFAYNGIQKCNVYTNKDIVAYDVRDPKEWGNKHILEVSTVSQRKNRPSMFYNNHAYLVLKDEHGMLRSVGQDILVYFMKPQYLQAFSHKRGEGLITTPDTSVFSCLYDKRISKVSFEITKGEHNKILEIIREDKRDLDRVASILKGNCASYVARLLMLGPKIEVNPFMSAIHIFLKHFLPAKLYRPLKKSHQLPKWFKRLIFYFPPIYCLQFVIGIGTIIMSKKSLNCKRDFSLIDLVFRPYIIGADHPLRLIRELERFKLAIKKPPLRGRGR